MLECCSDEDLQKFHAADLAASAYGRIEAHLADCDHCRRRGELLLARDSGLVDAAQAQFDGAVDTVSLAPSNVGNGPPPDIRIEGYDILRELGRGGQGVVYQAVQRTTKRKVAVKVLLEGPHASDGSRRRFEREIELVAQLRHPNIIAIFDSGTTGDGRPYYVMDYVRGDTLTDYIRDHRATLEQSLDVFAKVCDAVQFAHQRGVIHRDLKPSNIRVDAKGIPKLLDFGLARLAGPSMDTLSQAVVGTLPYMSPEQTRGNPEEIDTRTDIYALGVILYEMLTGHFPYPVTQNMAETLRNITEAVPTPPSRQWTRQSGITTRSDRRHRAGHCPIDDEIQTVVLKALAKEPDRRYQSAGNFARDIRCYLIGDPVEAKRDSGWYLFKVSFRRHRKRYLTAGALVVLACGWGASAVYSIDQERRLQQRVAREERVQRLLAAGANAKWVWRFETAIDKYDQVLDLDPDNRNALYEKAWCLRMLYLNDEESRHASVLQEAIALCARAGEIEQSANLLNLEGTLHRQAGAYDLSEQRLLKAQELDPGFFYAHSNLAKTYALQGRFEEAVATVQAGLEAATASDQQPRFNDGIWLTLATLRLHLDDREALADLQRAIDIDGEDHRSRMMLARYYLHPQFIDAPRALEEARNARLLTLNDPADGRIDRLLALAYLRNDVLDEAEYYAGQAPEHGDEPAYGRAIQAIVAARQGRDAAAARLLKGVQQNWPAFDDRGLRVTTDLEILWIDTEAELTRLLDEARQSLP